LQLVSTLTVSLPSNSAEMPWRPWEAMTMRSQPFDPAVSMIAWYGLNYLNNIKALRSKPAQKARIVFKGASRELETAAPSMREASPW